MSEASTQDPATRTTARPAEPGREWDSLRERVVAALEEDPVNEAVLVQHLDRSDPRAATPAQRVLAALTGLCPGPEEARRVLTDALDVQARWSARRGRPVALRLALMDLLLRENRRRPDPFRAELRLGRAPSSSGLADPAQGPTTASALVGSVQAELRRARRFRQEAALLRLHLDAWDDLVWQAGSAAAERALGAAALLVKNEIRDVDWAARTVDHDLVVFLSGTGRFGALLVANRIASKLAQLPLPGVAEGERTRASIGIAAFPADARFGWELLAAAQQAMFRARSEGGDGISDQGQPPARRLLRVHPESVRIVVRILPGRDTPPVDPQRREGLVFASPVPYDVGTGVELDCIEVAGSGRALLRGRIVRLEERLGGDFDVGVDCQVDPTDAALLRGRAARATG